MTSSKNVLNLYLWLAKHTYKPIKERKLLLRFFYHVIIDLEEKARISSMYLDLISSNKKIKSKYIFEYVRKYRK